MSLPASDNFGGVAGTNLETYNASWTAATGTGLKIGAGGVCMPRDASMNTAFWNADVFGNDQYSQFVITTGVNYLGPTIRASGVGGSANGYLWSAIDGFLYKIVAGTLSSAVQSGITAAVAGNTVKLEAIGTAIKMYINGLQVGTTYTDSAFASGAPGMFMYEGGSNPAIDTWTGDQIGGGGGGSNWGPMLAQQLNRIVQG